jgi:hypothetical protein
MTCCMLRVCLYTGRDVGSYEMLLEAGVFICDIGSDEMLFATCVFIYRP